MYEVVVESVADLSGNQSALYISTFTTGSESSLVKRCRFADTETVFERKAVTLSLVEYPEYEDITWSFGDSSNQIKTNEPSVTHTFSNPGRFTLTASLRIESGETISCTTKQVIHNPLTKQSPRHSSTMAYQNSSVMIVNPDHDRVTRVLDRFPAATPYL